MQNPQQKKKSASFFPKQLEETQFLRSTTLNDAYWGNASAIRSTVWQCHLAGPGGQRHIKVPTFTFLLSTASSAWKKKLLLFSWHHAWRYWQEGEDVKIKELIMKEK